MKKTLEQQLKEAKKLYWYYKDVGHGKKCTCFDVCLYPKLLETALRAEKRKVKELQQYKSFYDYKIKRY